MPVTKAEAQAKRGGQEMKKIFNIQPRIPSMKRPHTVDSNSVTFFKYGHSSCLTKHDFSVVDKSGPRDKPILNQRYVGFPIAVPDVSQPSVNEVTFRRTAHKKFLDENKALFRKKFYAECTSDHFHQSHLIRNYLNTMHPYSDPQDRGRTYSQSRLKTKERDLDPLPSGDFLNPKDPTRPRSTGYSPGHTRTILGLDSFGPNDSKRLEYARMVGELPASPNVDRERPFMNRDLSASPPLDTARTTSTVSTPPSSAQGRSRPRTMGSLDNPDMYLPPNMSRKDMTDGRSHNYQTNNRDIGAGNNASYDNGRITSSGSNGINKFDDSIGISGITKNIHGFDPSPETQGGIHTGGDNQSRGSKDSKRSSNQRQRAATSAGSRVQMNLPEIDTTGFYDGEDNNGGNNTARSATSRGGIKPPGIPKPPNENTQTGKLGYHGQAIEKEDIIMKDPIGRGIDWYNKLIESKKKKNDYKMSKKIYEKKRAYIKKDADSAVIDLEAFDIALEFRRTAKPADLPENNTKKSKMKQNSITSS